MTTLARPLAQIVLVSLLILGGLWVLSPFVVAILFAAVLCLSTWPVFEWLKHHVGQRRTLAALGMTLGLTLVLLVPLAILAGQVANGLGVLLDQVYPWFEQGGLSEFSEAPAWVATLPWVGESLQQAWVASVSDILSSQTELLKVLGLGAQPLRTLLLKTGSLLAHGVVQLSLVLLIAFFFYRDGLFIVRYLRAAVEKLGGEVGLELLNLASNTVTGVMNGIVGTALAQAMVMLLGLWVTGVPGVILLTFATFFLSLVPVGPPLIWGGAALWLYSQGSLASAVFLALYGLLVVSSVDNVLKPMLISRSAQLPILLIALGVFGGMLAFGFIGIFLGPTLLALIYVLLLHWLRTHSHAGLTD